MTRWFAVLLVLFSTALQARIETHVFASPEDEARYQTLTEELRCLVCQNQNLADSNAELAQDLRRQTYEMVQAGKSNEEIVAYMVQRYGDFVLYRPPLRPTTMLLWIGPFIILGIGVLILLAFIRRRGREQAPVLSAEEIARAESLLNNPRNKNP
jgi:cytochrome c-type biogenesis protein CcmH